MKGSDEPEIVDYLKSIGEGGWRQLISVDEAKKIKPASLGLTKELQSDLGVSKMSAVKKLKLLEAAADEMGGQPTKNKILKYLRGLDKDSLKSLVTKAV